MRIPLAVLGFRVPGEAVTVGTSHPWEEPGAERSPAESTVSVTAVPVFARVGKVWMCILHWQPGMLYMSLSSYVLAQKTAESSIFWGYTLQMGIFTLNTTGTKRSQEEKTPQTWELPVCLRRGGKIRNVISSVSVSPILYSGIWIN